MFRSSSILKSSSAIKSDEWIIFSSIWLVRDIIGEKIVKKVLFSDDTCKLMVDKLEKDYNIPKSEILQDETFKTIKDIVYKRLIKYLDANDTWQLETTMTNIKDMMPYTLVNIINQNNWPLTDFDNDFLSKVDGIAKDVLLWTIRDGLSLISAKANILKNNIPIEKYDGKVLVFKKWMRWILEFCLENKYAEFYVHPHDRWWFVVIAIPENIFVRGKYRFQWWVPALNDEEKKEFGINHIIPWRMAVIDSQENVEKFLEKIYK